MWAAHGLPGLARQGRAGPTPKGLGPARQGRISYMGRAGPARARVGLVFCWSWRPIFTPQVGLGLVLRACASLQIGRRWPPLVKETGLQKVNPNHPTIIHPDRTHGPLIKMCLVGHTQPTIGYSPHIIFPILAVFRANSGCGLFLSPCVHSACGPHSAHGSFSLPPKVVFTENPSSFIH